MTKRGFEDKVVLVTGAATGIGRASAIAFAREGARLAIADIDDSEAQQTERLAIAEGAQVLRMRVDVADEQAGHSERTSSGDAARQNFSRSDGRARSRRKVACTRLADWQRVPLPGRPGFFRRAKADLVLQTVQLPLQ